MSFIKTNLITKDDQSYNLNMEYIDKDSINLIEIYNEIVNTELVVIKD